MSNISDDWCEDQPWFEKEGFAAALVDKINILDILDKYGVEYIKTSAGNFTHKAKCPIPDHDERTASFCISEENNSCFCFGCLFSGNVIDLVMSLNSAPYHKALEILSNYLDTNGKSINEIDITPKEKIKPEHTIEFYIFRSGVAIRKFISGKKDTEEYDKWNRWAKKQFDRLDGYLNNLSDDKWEVTKKYYDKLIVFLNKR